MEILGHMPPRKWNSITGKMSSFKVSAKQCQPKGSWWTDQVKTCKAIDKAWNILVTEFADRKKRIDDLCSLLQVSESPFFMSQMLSKLDPRDNSNFGFGREMLREGKAESFTNLPWAALKIKKRAPEKRARRRKINHATSGGGADDETCPLGCRTKHLLAHCWILVQRKGIPAKIAIVWIAQIVSSFLPGHDVSLQLLAWSKSPEQSSSAAAFAGTGFVQVLLLDWAMLTRQRWEIIKQN